MRYIVPMPNQTLKEKGGTFTIKTKLSFSLDNYKEYLSDVANITLDASFAKEEYRIEIDTNSINVYASGDEGLFYAAISIFQMAHNYNNELPHATIHDKPRFKYRGFMFDVGRYFFSVDEIKKLMDLCAYLKINKFHFHLTEDQGWRIEIKKYPKLTEIGSKRSRTNYHFTHHAGFYTQEDIKELVRYSKTRFIELIPEIEMPGHAQAAIAAYKELSCFDRKLDVANTWGVKHDILCAGKEHTYTFEKDVLEEVMNLFDTEYMHIGGDEAPKTRWEICPCCQAKIKELGLKDENALQAYFVNYMNDFIKQHGRKTITWNEYEPTDNLDNDIIWQVWDVGANKDSISSSCLKNNRPIIYSILTDAYLDLPYSQTTLENTYTLKNLELFKDCNVVGVETALWGEFVPNMKVALKKALPRLFAISEAMWSNPEVANYSEFLNTLPRFITMFESLGYKGAKKCSYAPSPIRKIMQNIWWERRQLTWHGIYNLIDNAKVKSKYKKK